MWRDAARSAPRSEHFRMRSEFEAREREILSRYLIVGAGRVVGSAVTTVAAGVREEEDEEEDEFSGWDECDD
jgi:hypothetical protein